MELDLQLEKQKAGVAGKKVGLERMVMSQLSGESLGGLECGFLAWRRKEFKSAIVK